MGCCFHLPVFFDQISLFIDDKGGPFNAHVFPAVHALFFQHAVKIDYLFLFIRKQREIELIFIPEIAVFLNGIPAYAKDCISQLFKILQMVPEGLRLQGAAPDVLSLG